jgi:hypothetical protein
MEDLEREYRVLLTKALTRCARGRWGLFGHNERLHPTSRPAEVDELQDLARAINRLRTRIGEMPFALHEEFEAARGPADANAAGERKQAQEWLHRLSED